MRCSLNSPRVFAPYFFALFCYFATAHSFAQATYQLIVTNGYGSGTYAAGDTVDVWGKETPANNIFGKWTGADAAALEDTTEWHTTLVMPAHTAFITANNTPYTAFSFKQEQIKGKNNLKNVYSYFPTGMKGVILCFHGTGGTAANWITATETRQFVTEAVVKHFGVIVTESEETTLNTDLNGDGKLRWLYNPLDSVQNVDIANVKAILDTFRLRGKIGYSTPKYAVGMSAGSFFAPLVSSLLGFKGQALFCGQGTINIWNTTTVPTMFCMAKYDNNDNVGAAGNAAALTNYQTLTARGVCSRYRLHDSSPFYAERLRRVTGILPTVATSVYNELLNNSLLDSLDYPTDASDSVAIFVAADPASFPVLHAAQPVILRAIYGQLDAAYAAHQFYSDYDKAVLRFFENACNTAVSTDAATEAAPYLLLYPNPASNTLTIRADEPIQRISIVDLSGKTVLYALCNSTETNLNTSALPNGVYFVVAENVRGVAVHSKVVVTHP